MSTLRSSYETLVGTFEYSRKATKSLHFTVTRAMGSLLLAPYCALQAWAATRSKVVDNSLTDWASHIGNTPHSIMMGYVGGVVSANIASRAESTKEKPRAIRRAAILGAFVSTLVLNAIAESPWGQAVVKATLGWVPPELFSFARKPGDTNAYDVLYGTSAGTSMGFLARINAPSTERDDVEAAPSNPEDVALVAHKPTAVNICGQSPWRANTLEDLAWDELLEPPHYTGPPLLLDRSVACREPAPLVDWSGRRM